METIALYLGLPMFIVWPVGVTLGMMGVIAWIILMFVWTLFIIRLFFGKE